MLNAEGISEIDTTGSAVLRSVVEEMHANGVIFGVARMKADVGGRLERSGLAEVIGTENFFPWCAKGWRTTSTSSRFRSRFRPTPPDRPTRHHASSRSLHPTGVHLQAMRILVVEDEPRIADFVARGLAENGYSVDTARDGEEALHWPSVAEFDVIILDVMLPRVDGIEVCQTLRRQGTRTPILMLTARDAVEDRVKGLDSGADDYLVKPFAFAELLARVRALCRREPALLGTTLTVGDLSLDTITRHVSRGGASVDLTAKEFALLEYLMRHPDQVLSRTVIAEHVWNYDFDNVTNVIDVHVKNLRRKIDGEYEHKLIHTMRGIGYRISARGAG
ncbi:MAG: heavy metal response regulator transcription factor [Dehalococcoidia bacterium]